MRILKGIDSGPTGRCVLIVADIIDSGLTPSWLLANLRCRGAKSVDILALLHKSEAAKVALEIKYVGFEIP